MNGQTESQTRNRDANKFSVICTVKQQLLISEFTVPLKIPFQPKSFLVPPFPLHPFLCLLQSSPVHTPCPPQPLSVIPCTPTVTLSLLLSSLVHVSVIPVSPRHPLHGRWLLNGVLCSIYIITSAVTIHEIKSAINILVHEMNCEMYSTYYNNAPVVWISLQFMNLQNKYFYFNSFSHSLFLS